MLWGVATVSAEASPEPVIFRLGGVGVGYWSVFASVDSLDDSCDYPVPVDADDALRAVLGTVPMPGRVSCEQLPDGSVRATTTQHTPAWVFAAWLLPPVGLALTLAVRVNRTATVTATATPTGSVLHARGKLDTGAASRLRSLRAPA